MKTLNWVYWLNLLEIRANVLCGKLTFFRNCAYVTACGEVFNTTRGNLQYTLPLVGNVVLVTLYKSGLFFLLLQAACVHTVRSLHCSYSFESQ